MTDKKFNAEDSLAILKSKDQAGLLIIKRLAVFALAIKNEAPDLLDMFSDILTDTWMDWEMLVTKELPEKIKAQLAESPYIYAVALDQVSKELSKVGSD